jgi:hypothetical protein
LETEYASVVDPIVDLIDNLAETRDEQIVVLIPDILPSKARYSLLHNHIDFVLSNALRQREDIVLARCRMSVADLENSQETDAPQRAAARESEEVNPGS